MYRAGTLMKMWENPERRFGKQDNYAHIFKIKQEIAKCKQGAKPFKQLYGDMQRKWDELDILEPEVTDPGQIRERKDQEQVFLRLANFDSSYEQLWS
jgi:hypothetical protein